MAGIANFQPSPEKTELYNCSKSTVAGVDGGSVREMSYIAIVRETASLCRYRVSICLRKSVVCQGHILNDFIEENSCRSKVSMASHRGHYTGIVHDLPCC